MKTYNRALDYMALAVKKAGEGKVNTAAACLAKAVAQPDCEAAIAIIEASNAQAFDAHQKAVKAAAAKAKRAVQAEADDEDGALEELVGPIDELDEDEDGDVEVDEDGDIDVEQEGDDAEELEVDSQALAKALASLVKAAPKKVVRRK